MILFIVSHENQWLCQKIKAQLNVKLKADRTLEWEWCSKRGMKSKGSDLSLVSRLNDERINTFNHMRYTKDKRCFFLLYLNISCFEV